MHLVMKPSFFSNDIHLGKFHTVLDEFIVRVHEFRMTLDSKPLDLGEPANLRFNPPFHIRFLHVVLIHIHRTDTLATPRDHLMIHTKREHHLVVTRTGDDVLVIERVDVVISPVILDVLNQTSTGKSTEKLRTTTHTNDRN